MSVMCVFVYYDGVYEYMSYMLWVIIMTGDACGDVCSGVDKRMMTIE